MGRTPMHIAVFNRDLELTEFLAKETNADIGVKDQDGMTALDLCYSD